MNTPTPTEMQVPNLAIIWSRKPFRAYLNILRVALERRLRRDLVRGMPFVLYYEPTSFCILKCPSCPTGIGILDYPRAKVRFKDFAQIIERMSDYVFTLIMYNWGEPLLHEDFAKMVKFATQRGIMVRASSNLSMQISDEQAEEIVKSGLVSLKVGIDGSSPEVHAMYRKGSDLRLVHNNIRRLKSAKHMYKSNTPEITVTYHAFLHNEHEIPDFLLQAPSLGVDSYSISAAWIPTDGSVSLPRDPRYNMYRQVNSIISGLRSRGEHVPACSWLYFCSVINPGGSISPCCGVLSERLDFGSIKGEHAGDDPYSLFRSTWNGTKYRAARRQFSDPDLRKLWIAKNLRDMTFDGMGFSQLSSKDWLICVNCPIPHTLEQWNTQLESIRSTLFSETLRCIRMHDLPGLLSNGIKTAILLIAVAASRV